MFKNFFIVKAETTEIDLELERTMQTIHDRMERMLCAEKEKRQRFSSIDTTPSYYR
jgi:hypothetical protein